MAQNDVEAKVKIVVDSKAFNAALKQANKEAKEFKRQQSSAFKGAGDDISKAFGNAIGAVTKLAPALSAGAAAMAVAKKAMQENQTITDEWARITESARASWEGFVDAIVSADFGNYFSNMSEIIRQAREAADAMDTLGTTQLFTNRAMSEYDLKIRQARTIIKDPNSTKEQREAAAQDIQNAQAAQLADAQRLSNDYMVAFASKLAQYVTSKGSKATATDYIEQDANGNWQIKAGSLFEKYYGDLAAYERKSAEYAREKALRSTVVGSISMGQYGSESVYGKGNLSDEEYAELRAYVELSDEKLKEVFDLFAAARQNLSRVYTSQNENFEYLNRVVKEGGGGGLVRPSIGGAAEAAVPAGSIADIEARLAEATKAWSRAVDEEARASAKALMDAIKEELEVARTGRIKTDKLTPVGVQVPEGLDLSTVVMTTGLRMEQEQEAAARKRLNDLIKDTTTSVSELTSAMYNFSASVHSATASFGDTSNTSYYAGSFATGGIIGGTSYRGDRLTAQVSSGEMILNKIQQRNLLGLAQGGGAMQVTTLAVSGDKLLLVINNALLSKGKTPIG